MCFDGPFVIAVQSTSKYRYQTVAMLLFYVLQNKCGIVYKDLLSCNISGPGIAPCSEVLTAVIFALTKYEGRIACSLIFTSSFMKIGCLVQDNSVSWIPFIGSWRLKNKF